MENEVAAYKSGTAGNKNGRHILFLSDDAFQSIRQLWHQGQDEAVRREGKNRRPKVQNAGKRERSCMSGKICPEQGQTAQKREMRRGKRCTLGRKKGRIGPEKAHFGPLRRPGRAAWTGTEKVWRKHTKRGQDQPLNSWSITENRAGAELIFCAVFGIIHWLKACCFNI
jgi:hypothetical protein